MIEECVVAVYPSIDRAREAIHRLMEENFPAGQVSMVTLGLIDDPRVIEELKLQDDSLHDAAVVAGLGSIVGILTGLSMMLLPGMGVVFLLGPVGGGIVGGLVGGFVGAMSGWGVHEHQLSRYQRLVEEGNALVIANGYPLQLVQAHVVLERTEPSELHTYARVGDEAVEVE